MKIKNWFISMTALLLVSANADAQEGAFKAFVLNGSTEYATLQEAIDNAPASGSSTIEVKPCPSGVAEYDAAYATNIAANVTANGAEIFTKNKSLTIKGKSASYRPVLKDFVIVFESNSGTKPDYSISNLSFSGKSIIIVDNSHGNFGTIELYGCTADVINRTASYVKLKNNDNVGATYASGTFMQWMQRASGTTEKLLFHDNNIVARLSAPGGNVRIFNGGMMTKVASIKNNVFGSAQYPVENESGWVMVSQCTAKNAAIEFCDNEIHQRGYNGTIWVLATAVEATGLDLRVHDNSIFLHNLDRPRYDPSGNGDMLVYIPKNYVISGKVRAWKNYINGYCFNEVVNSLGSAVEVDVQVGHTNGDGHIHSIESDANMLVRKYGIKKDDIYLHNKADSFNGTTHSSPIVDLGTSHYCDRCDVILSAITIACSGLEEGESVFFDIRDSSNTLVQTVCLNGNVTASASRTIIGLEPGRYSVTPSRTDWSWTYNAPAGQQKTIAPLNKVTGQADFTFEFSLSKKSGNTVKNAENFKVDNLK